MTPERWQQVEAVLQEALDRPPLERASFLDHACGGDEELKEEASSLIAAYDEAGGFIEQPAMAQDAHVLLGVDTDANRGRQVGPYRIIDRLGAGGMAEVYLACHGPPRPRRRRVPPAGAGGAGAPAPVDHRSAWRRRNGGSLPGPGHAAEPARRIETFAGLLRF